MTVSESLQDFYYKNNFAKDGGESEDTFDLKFRFFSLKLPNSQFRKKVIHIHDIQHILYNCNTSWKGEAFITGWEIVTGFWKHLPVGFFSIWAMGFSLLTHPKAGLNTKGVIDLKMKKETLLKLSIPELKLLIKKEKTQKLNWFLFIFWATLSKTVVLFPLLLIIYGLIYFL